MPCVRESCWFPEGVSWAMLLLRWDVVAAAELWCPAVTMVMDMRLPLSQRWTLSAALSRVGVEECVHIQSKAGWPPWHWALKLLPPSRDFSRWCERLMQAHGDIYDGQHHQSDRDSCLPRATKIYYTLELLAWERMQRLQLCWFKKGRRTLCSQHTHTHTKTHSQTQICF